jgi:hypothetical protein
MCDGACHARARAGTTGAIGIFSRHVASSGGIAVVDFAGETARTSQNLRERPAETRRSGARIIDLERRDRSCVELLRWNI